MSTSNRYSTLPVRTLVERDGRSVRYLAPRRVPLASTLSSSATAAPTAGERPDTLASRTMGTPFAFWQLADANNAATPFDLVTQPPRLLRIPDPKAGS